MSAQMRLFDRFVETEALGDLLVARILEDVPAVADQHGDVRHPHVEAIEQLLDADLLVEVHKRVGIPVPREEFLDAQRARAMSRADEHRVAKAARHQRHPPQDKRPHDDVAEVGVGLYQAQQLIASQLDQLRQARWHARAPGNGGRRACSPRR
jgi:hypothetical protein